MTTNALVIPLFIMQGEHAYRFEVSVSHDCWYGCARCNGAGCVNCGGKGYFDNGKVESRVEVSWNEPDFSDIEVTNGPECCPNCGASFKEMVGLWMEKWREDDKGDDTR